MNATGKRLRHFLLWTPRDGDIVTLWKVRDVRLDTLPGASPMDLQTLELGELLQGQAGIGIRWACRIWKKYQNHEVEHSLEANCRDVDIIYASEV